MTSNDNDVSLKQSSYVLIDGTAEQFFVEMVRIIINRSHKKSLDKIGFIYIT